LGVGRAGVIRAAELISKLSAPNPDSPAARDRIVDGLLIPARPKVKIETSGLVERFLAQQRLVGDRGEAAADYGRDVREILAFFAGDYRESDDTDFHAVQAEGVDLEVWVLGSSRGASSAAAGSLGLPFGANYHVSPTSVIDAVAGYRDAFVPSARLAKPYVAVSADVVVAEDEAKARELASGYGQWVLSVRSGLGAIEFPSPAEAAEFEWTDELREAVSDRTRTQFVGTPEQVGGQLATLRDATRADELVVTTITHEHADRVRSYELLAKSWANLNH
jgi:luciferase family oxidoreductase group 1